MKELYLDYIKSESTVTFLNCGFPKTKQSRKHTSYIKLEKNKLVQLLYLPKSFKIV